MLSRGVRSLLSFQKNYLLKSPLSFSNRVYFSSFGSGNDGDDKPDGNLSYLSTHKLSLILIFRL